MDQRAASSDASSRRRGRTNRRQYQSCDRCRKGRRGCDAVSLGIGPFSPSDLTTSSQIKHRGCSGCKKFNKECTFEWLRSIPLQDLPRRLQTKPKPSEQRFRDQPGFDATFPSANLPPTYNAQQPEKADTGTNSHDELDLNIDLDCPSLPEDGFPLTADYWLGSILRPTLPGHIAVECFSGAACDPGLPELFDQSSFSRDQLHGVKSTGESGDLAVWVQNNNRTGQTYKDSGHDQFLETLWVDETYPLRQSDPGMQIITIDEIQETSLEDQNDLLELEHY